MLIKINSDSGHASDRDKLNDLIKNTINVASSELGIRKKKLIHEISILITTSAKIKELNRRYRKKSFVTNVLAFPQTLKIKKHSSIKTNKDLVILGDIVLCIDKIKDEAKLYSKSFYDHFSHITLHGFLHLLGFDHIQNKDALEMEKKEIEILSKLSIENPYIYNQTTNNSIKKII